MSAGGQGATPAPQRASIVGDVVFARLEDGHSTGGTPQYAVQPLRLYAAASS